MNFDEAWKAMEAKGYRYGRDALEQVRFGWELCVRLSTAIVKCPECNGEGHRMTQGESPVPCRTCKGTGKVAV